MVYADEDEIDWSDGSFGAPPRILIDATPQSTHHNPTADAYEEEDSVFVSETYYQHRIPSGLTLQAEAVRLHFPAPSNSNDNLQNPTRVQRARAGVHLNRRIPSKADYINYVLYQASQKTYEATFLNNFIAHALHPDRLAQCSEDANSSRQSIADYMKSVSHEVNSITKKMIWNGHCRTVHLLAGDGMDGAPFLDPHALDTKPFSKYGPGNLFPVADRINVSWHRTSSHPTMVRYSTKEYELGYQAGPLEEIDAVSQTLFRKENFSMTLPIGRAVKLSTSKKRKGQNMCGAATRDDRLASSRRNWIPFPQLAIMSDFHGPQSVTSTPLDIGHEAKAADVHQEPQILSDLTQLYHDPVNALSLDDAQEEGSHQPFPRYEVLFGSHDAGVPISDRAGACKQSNGTEHVEKVHHWRTRLINDHKRRLTLKWGNPPQALDHAFQNFKQVVAAAMSMGIRPTANDDYQKKLEAIAARERLREQARSSARSQQNSESLSTETTTPDSRASQCLPIDSDMNTPESSSCSPLQILRRNIGGSLSSSESDKTSSEPPKKRRRKNETANKQVMRSHSTQQQSTAPKPGKQSTNQSIMKSPLANKPLSLHPSGSTTLELHQHLPPNAYFEPISVDEKYAWRCRCKHAMGHYYNSGNRKNCRGCNTSLGDNHAVEMDFYMPLRSFYHQPAPDMRWKPSKQTARLRKSDRPCHNAVAKDAYWQAVGTGATEEVARQIAVDAVVHYLRPKVRSKGPTPEPTPESEPEPDLGPHPSGSTTMEHGQEIPDGYYWKKQKAGEKLAWRCDVNHGLGRYYLAGDKKTCPGCGAGRTSLGKSEDMDFYLPSGVVVRQEAPGLSIWKPRKPYKIGKPATTKREAVSHNQMCAKVYFELLAQEHEAEEALALAIERVDSELDKKQEAKMKRQEAKEEIGDSDAVEGDSTSASVSRRDSAATSRNSRGGCTMSFVPKKRTIDDVMEESLDEVVGGLGDRDMGSEKDSCDSVVVSSSSDEDSSASDSE
ncbi:uncharacterized protein J4E84_000010 [Alternaria hordeiaustralica]|uniref:uncharacterized protein n=1 Tax=Alternaria hordeiaustralica TaxID=1187925 RepID=UPI0020C206FD|nr:uncharacterized protein J4E84_000010 [Alternaria hordeiaustralica]KAI4696887.1 hypothetical protein J4E84_000010 [Alternaria hordeiaustralica]